MKLLFVCCCYILSSFQVVPISGNKCDGYVRSWLNNSLYWYIDGENNGALRLTKDREQKTLFELSKISRYHFIPKDEWQNEPSTGSYIYSFVIKSGPQIDTLLCVKDKEEAKGNYIEVCKPSRSIANYVAFNMSDINSEKPGNTFRMEGKNDRVSSSGYFKPMPNRNVWVESREEKPTSETVWEFEVRRGCKVPFDANETMETDISTTETTTCTYTKTNMVSLQEADYGENIQNGGDNRLLVLEETIINSKEENRPDIDQKIMNTTVDMDKFFLKSANSLSENVSIKLQSKFFEGEIGKGYTPLFVAMQDNFIEAKSIDAKEKAITYSSIVYLNLHKKLSDGLQIKGGKNLRSTQGKFQINSMLVSLSVQQPDAVSEVSLVLQHQVNATIGSNVCAFWNDTGLGFWSTYGCRKVNYLSNHSHTACSCNHLTNFAILTSFENTIPPIHEKILSVLSLVCCGISISFLFVGILLLAVLLNGDRRHSRLFVHFNLMLALFIVQVIFVTGIEATDNKIICRGIALTLHYFLLATFGWMLMEGLHLYVTVIKVFADAAKKLKFYFIFAWGYPIIILAITAGVNIDFYGNENYCWMNEKGFWSVLGPMLVVMFLNTAILIVLVKEIVHLSKSDGLTSDTKTAVRSAIFLMPLLGITWIFAMLTFYSKHILFQYIFAVTNSLQGFMLTLLHCFCNRDVRKALKRKAEIWGHSSSANSIRYHSQRISRSHDSYSMSIFQSSSKKSSTVTLLEKNCINQNTAVNEQPKKAVKISFDTTATQVND